MPDEFVIDLEAVMNKLSKINVRKSPGPDGLPNWVLQDFCTLLVGLVCVIFNATIREGAVTLRWKEANVIPAPKVQPFRLIEMDLQPILLTATLGNLLESFIGQWILQCVQNQLDDHQYGAVRRRSTIHALVDMLHHWHSAVDKSNSVRIVFIDFAKAFDHTDHNILMTKLVALGLPDTINRWMYSFLCHRQQRIKIGNVLSEWVEMTTSMPQGSYLGPLTFIILTDSLKPACLTHKYIDDTTLTEILHKSTASFMQSIINDVVQQSSLNAMKINGRKTKEMLLGPITKDMSPLLILNSATIERVRPTSFKLLGVHVSNDLKWAQHINAISSE